MSRTDKDQLRELLSSKVETVTADAIEADGQVPEEKVASVERLARLAEISDAARPQVSRSRWPLLACFGITVLIVSILLFARVSETEIELDLIVSETSFVVPSQQVLTDLLSVSSVGASRLREIQLPSPGAGVKVPSPVGPNYAIRLSAASEQNREGAITLAPTMLPGGAHVRVKHAEVPHQFQLSLKGERLALRVDVIGPVQVGLASVPAEQLNYGVPASILLEPASDEVDLDLMLQKASRREFSPQLSVKELAFFRVDEFTDLNRTLVRRVSTILSGTLYLESLNGEKRSLRPGEALYFEQSQGEIRTLKLNEDHIALMFHGTVRGMGSGSGANRRSLMPTYLEWLRARHGLYLLWGTTFYVFGLVGGLLRWWRNP